MKAIDKFGRYLGLLDIEVDGEKLELDVRLKDKHKLMSCFTSKNTEEVSEEQISTLSNILLKILQRSYLPFYDKEKDIPDAKTEEETKDNETVNSALESFLTVCFEKLISEISIAFGWSSSEKINSLKKNP